MLWILRIPASVFTASFLHPDPPLSPQGLALLKSFVEWTLPSAVVLSYNMVLTTTSKLTFLPLSLLIICLITSYCILAFGEVTGKSLESYFLTRGVEQCMHKREQTIMRIEVAKTVFQHVQNSA